MLAPDAEELLELMTAVLPRFETLPAPQARAAMKATAIPRDPEPVGDVEDRTIPGPAGEIPVRVYRPAAPGPHPLVVFFHGGGWVICDLDTHDGFCRAMCNAAQVAVMSVDYRLAPEHPFPAAADDAYAATRWAFEHASELGADPEHLAVAGDSAGGNLAAVTALTARDRGGPTIAFQLLVYPVIDSGLDTASYEELAEGYFLTRDAMRWFWECYVPDPAQRTDPRCAPLHAPDLSRLPPAFIVTAEFDPLRDEGETYGKRLAEAGVDVDVRRYDGVFHGFFSMRDYLEGARRAQSEAFGALREALHEGGA